MSKCIVKYRDGRTEEVDEQDVPAKRATFTNPAGLDKNCTTGVVTLYEYTDAQTTALRAEQAKGAAAQAARDQAEAAAKAQRDKDMAAVKAKAATDPAFAALARLLEK